MKWRSEWQRPATLVRIRTSRGPGFCRLMSSIARGLFTSCRTAAFIDPSLDPSLNERLDRAPFLTERIVMLPRGVGRKHHRRPGRLVERRPRCDGAMLRIAGPREGDPGVHHVARQALDRLSRAGEAVLRRRLESAEHERQLECVAGAEGAASRR